MSYLWTTEAVSAGHPDKVADQVADAILDAHLIVDPESRVACEVVVTRDNTGQDLVILLGEIGSNAGIIHTPQLEAVVRETLLEIGYDRPDNGFDANNVIIENRMREQSPEIANAVVKDSGQIGAGDQGLMFGFACDETPTLMPLAHYLAFDILRLIEQDIKTGRGGQFGGSWDSPFLPDAKTQITLEYSDEGIPQRVHTVVVSVCHRKDVNVEEVREKTRNLFFEVGSAAGFPDVSDQMANLFDDQTVYHCNPAGEWNLGGPAADTGLSGRKIVVDNYGADCPIGGGSFSGKDPTKVDRSAAYAARHIAKNIVGSGLAKRTRVQVAYAIGVVEPLSMRLQSHGIESVETFGTSSSKISDEQLTKMVRDLVSMTPQAIIERLNLRKPIYRQTARGGHFGNNTYPWEALDLLDEFDNYLKK